MKISVVMQSYLGDYPGSRSHPEYKFTRAIHSFLSQKHDDKELVVVADGCEKTKLLYETLYRNDPRIKFVYLAPESRKMYDIENGKEFRRGTPRRFGCSLSTGDIIAYMDSDDIMLPNRLSDLERDWSIAPPETVWMSNSVRFLHSDAVTNPLFKEPLTHVEPLKILHLQDYGYDIKNSFWLNVAAPEGRVSGASYSISHKRSAQARWRDVALHVDESGKTIAGISEDHDFLNQLMAQDKFGFRQESPAYVICHYTGIWDV